MLKKLATSFSLQGAIAKRTVSSTRAFGAFVNHRDTNDNLEETPFEFTQENYEKIQDKLNNFPVNYKHSACIPVLFIAQK